MGLKSVTGGAAIVLVVLGILTGHTMLLVFGLAYALVWVWIDVAGGPGRRSRSRSRR